jgi:hypothetical protein
MADNPWAGIQNMGALDQKLYQPSEKAQQPTPSPAQEQKEVQAINRLKRETEAALPVEKQVVSEQEIRMTLPLPESSVALLDTIERTIFIHRDITYRSKQRLTKNNVARSWISLLGEIDVDWTNIKDDADLTERLRKAVGK